jgi:hypothetical protein
VTNGGALALDAISATSLGVDTSAGNGAVTQNAPVVVTGTTAVNAGSGAITLNNAGNDFSNAAGNSFTGGAINLRDTNALTITTLANGANQPVTVVAGGALTLPGAVTTTADITLSSGATLTMPGTLSGNNISLTGTAGMTLGADVTAAGNLSLTTTNTAVNQTAGKITAGGATTVTAGTGAVTLAQPLDDFNSINVVSGGQRQRHADDHEHRGAQLGRGALRNERLVDRQRRHHPRQQCHRHGHAAACDDEPERADQSNGRSD